MMGGILSMLNLWSSGDAKSTVLCLPDDETLCPNVSLTVDISPSCDIPASKLLEHHSSISRRELMDCSDQGPLLTLSKFHSDMTNSLQESEVANECTSNNSEPRDKVLSFSHSLSRQHKVPAHKRSKSVRLQCCDKCGKVLSSPSSLKRHSNSIHRNSVSKNKHSPTSSLKFGCIICFRRFSSEAVCSRHVIQHKRGMRSSHVIALQRLNQLNYS